MSGFQSPQLLTDLYRDLRDRRLLPLVLVLVVGLAVVPMALSSKQKSTPAPASPPVASVAQKSNAPSTPVVASDPGLRDYQRRLKDEAAKDPFIQQFLAPAPGSTQQGGATFSSPSDTSGTSGVSPTSSSGTTPTETSAPTGGSTSQPAPTTQSKFYRYQVKLRTGQAGGEMKVRENVNAVTPLPSKAVPALAFLGVTTDSDFQPQTAVFLVSSSVSLITGDGECTFTGTQCQLLSLEPGEHADLTWTDGLTYRVTMVKFNLIVRNELPGGQDNGDSSGRNGDSSSRRGDSGWHSPTGKYFTF